jgi:NADP-dependent 3-hydroxy acid dehydrogenase YdfG
VSRLQRSVALVTARGGVELSSWRGGSRQRGLDGRTARYPTASVYCLTKYGLRGFGDSLRLELARRRVRVATIEPGTTRTDLARHYDAEILAQREKAFRDIELLEAGDIAEAIEFVVTRPARAAMDEVLVRPVDAS